MKWKLIETAPMDAKEVWLGAPGHVVLGYFGMGERWRSSWTTNALQWQPTHWMSFQKPEPPR